ncbi:MAG: hypothetical protein HC875_36330 [Anaerolineales bacterium]|nr:hypothetical protein [Anaerolineales bacterium]
MKLWTVFSDLEDGDVFLIEGDIDFELRVKEIFPEQDAPQDVPVPNNFKVNYPRFYTVVGDNTPVVRLTILQHLSDVIKTMEKAGLIE